MKRQMVESTAGVFVLIGLMVLVYMTIQLGDVALPGEDPFILKARFTSVTGLRTGNPVEMYGIEIGRVADLAIDESAQMARVTLELDQGIQVYDDAIASIKTAGLIGDKFVNIDPGGSGILLENGGVIINTESPVDIGDLIGKYAFGGVSDESDDLDFGEEIQ